MKITFSTSSLQKLCENDKKLTQKYKDKATYIQRRINELKIFDNLYFIRINPAYGLHTLSGDRKGTLAIYVKMGDKTIGLRLIIKNKNGENVCNDFENIELFKSITEIEIMEISNHYK